MRTFLIIAAAGALLAGTSSPALARGGHGWHGHRGGYAQRIYFRPQPSYGYSPYGYGYSPYASGYASPYGYANPYGYAAPYASGYGWPGGAYPYRSYGASILLSLGRGHHGFGGHGFHGGPGHRRH